MPAPVPALELPAKLGPYTLTERIGRGGMALVYRATREGASGFTRQVVVKVLHPVLSAHRELVSRFADEARLLARLSHPNIVQVHDFGVAEGTPYLAMELLDGRNLLELRELAADAREAVPVGVAVAVGRELMQALSYLHGFRGPHGRRRVVHHDVSPSNVMLCRDGSVKLLDFGVASILDELEREVPEVGRGKHAYLAPEQVAGRPADHRVDLWAAGVVLHELLTGRPLFAAPSRRETLRRVAKERVLPPSFCNARVPEVLDAMVMRLLEREPERRLAEASEAADALDGLGIAYPRGRLQQWLGRYAPVACPRCGGEPTACVCLEGNEETRRFKRPRLALVRTPVPLEPSPEEQSLAERTDVDVDPPEFVDDSAELEPVTFAEPEPEPASLVELRSFDVEIQEEERTPDRPVLRVVERSSPRFRPPETNVEPASRPIDLPERAWAAPPALSAPDEGIESDVDVPLPPPPEPLTPGSRSLELSLDDGVAFDAATDFDSDPAVPVMRPAVSPVRPLPASDHPTLGEAPPPPTAPTSPIRRARPAQVASPPRPAPAPWTAPLERVPPPVVTAPLPRIAPGQPAVRLSPVAPTMMAPPPPRPRDPSGALRLPPVSAPWARTIAAPAVDPRPVSPAPPPPQRRGPQLAYAMPAVYPSSPVQLDLAAAGGFRSGRRHRGTAEVPELRGGWRGGPALVLVAAAIALAMVIGATLTRLGRHGAAPLDEVQPVIVVPAARPVERPLPKLVDLPVVTQLAAPAAEEEQEVRRVEARPAAAQEEQVARAHPAPVVHHSAPPAHHHHRPAARRERPASSTREAPRTVKQGRLVDPFSE